MSAISNFLKHKVIFLTGATGFLGKVLVEKVLRHSDTRRIYLLIRPRRLSNGTVIEAEERLENEIISSPVFNRLRIQWGNEFQRMMRDKLVAVSGDLSEDRLGIEEVVFSNLTQEVDIVISIAATVVFDEPLDLALELNTLGPVRILDFAKSCRDPILVHVSTAYVNGQLPGAIDEKPPQPDTAIFEVMGNGHVETFVLEEEITSIQKLAEQVRKASKDPTKEVDFRRTLARQNRGKRVTEHRLSHQLEALRQRWVRKQLVEAGMTRARELGWHDSYTLTKAMGEQMIVKLKGDLPVAIVRPSIIESSYLDPEPGWLEDLKVADSLIAHYGKGRLPDFPANPNVVIDVIPVDLVVNAVVAALPRVRESEDVKVYHVATGSKNPVLVGELFDLVYDYFKQNPMQDRHGNPIDVDRWKFPTLKQFQRSFRLKYQVPLVILKGIIDYSPFLPWSARLRRKFSIQEATLERVLSLSEIYGAYTNLDCRFLTENIAQLFYDLDSEDQEIYNLDVSTICWQKYFQEIHIPGLKRHVLKASSD